ncbi:hypothetical protein F4782DRAFT_490408 [Xylaria castorea]|nr:hypothetical protein F4782DRAFT_490408 [Xylaria castorea]
MASLTNIDAPGAYPVTPLNEEPTSQIQHSNLQHQAAPTLSHDNATQQAPFNQETPRSLGNDVKSQDHLSGDSRGLADDLHSSREGGSEKPGFMTGAYSRVGTHPSGSTQNANYTYDDIASQSPYGENTRQSNPATNLAANTPANAPAENTAINSINNTSAHSHGSDHNKIQSGLRGSADTGNNEPYWGDIPFGTGVYNGVTGHGSNEPTTHQGSLHDQYDTATNTGIYNGVTGHGSNESTAHQGSLHDQHDTASNTGIYNGVTGHGSNEPTDRSGSLRGQHDTASNTGIHDGVTGHGSNELTDHSGSLRDQYNTPTNTGIYNSVTGHGSKRSTSPESSKYDEGIAAADSAHQQRAFPLANNGSTPTATTKSNDVNEHKRDSRFTEGLAGVGATAAGGYAAHKYLNKDNDGSARATDEMLMGERSNQLGQNTPDALSQPRSHKGDEVLNRHEGKEQSLPHRPFVAAPMPDSTQQKTLDRQSLDTENVNKHQKKEDSNFAKQGAVAAFTGAGAYGADKYAHRDSTKEHPSKPENMVSQSTAREPAQSDAQPLYAENENKHQNKEGSDFAKYGATAAAAGAGAHGVNKYANRDSAKEPLPVSENNTSQRIARESNRNDSQVVGDNSRAQPQHSMLSDSIPAGIAATSAHQPENVDRSGASQSERHNVSSDRNLTNETQSTLENVNPSGASQSERHNVSSDRTSANETQSTGRASSDSSHGGLYNVLSSGTPSGVNLDHMRAEKQHHHEQQPEQQPQQQQPTSRFLSNAPAPSSSRTVATGERNPAAALKNTSQYPAKQVANEVPEQVPSAGNETSTGSAFTSGRQMTHKCTSCGQEDDISHYMRI